jgi:hypothetical protein
MHTTRKLNPGPQRLKGASRGWICGLGWRNPELTLVEPTRGVERNAIHCERLCPLRELDVKPGVAIGAPWRLRGLAGSIACIESAKKKLARRSRRQIGGVHVAEVRAHLLGRQWLCPPGANADEIGIALKATHWPNIPDLDYRLDVSKADSAMPGASQELPALAQWSGGKGGRRRGKGMPTDLSGSGRAGSNRDRHCDERAQTKRVQRTLQCGPVSRQPDRSVKVGPVAAFTSPPVGIARPRLTIGPPNRAGLML